MKHISQRLSLFATLPISLLIAGCGAPASQTSTTPTASKTAASNVAPRTASKVAFDQQFIDSMVPHHESAVKMAQMIETRAQFPEVRALSKAIIADQTREIAQMKAWRKAWFGSDVMPSMAEPMDHSTMDHSQMDHSAMSGSAMSGAMNDVMTMPGRTMGLPITGAMDMKKLRAAKGSEVDREFLRMMIPHHANAITMAQEVLLQSKRPELQKLARQIIAAQAREIGDMEAIARKRFGSL